jgi:hypothetical protein
MGTLDRRRPDQRTPASPVGIRRLARSQDDGHEYPYPAHVTVVSQVKTSGRYAGGAPARPSTGENFLDAFGALVGERTAAEPRAVPDAGASVRGRAV